jgi:hypothetical protein
MTAGHEPSLQLFQFATHLAPLLGPMLRRCALLFGELAVLGSSFCESRKAVLGPWASGSPSMESTAARREPSRPLACRSFTGLGAAPLARPIGAKSPWSTLFEVGVCHAQISTIYGVLLYPILDGVARCVCLGPSLN